MYPLENPYPKFIPMDLCWVKGTNELVLVKEVNCNKGQKVDDWQWSFAVECLTPGNTKVAWYKMDELVFIKNMFDVIAAGMKGRREEYGYNFTVSHSARRPLLDAKSQETVEE